jgi:hypothetical protein
MDNGNETKRHIDLFRGAPEFRRRKALNALAALFPEKMPERFLEIVQEVRDSETPMSPPVLRGDNTDKILSVARSEFRKMPPGWLDELNNAYAGMIEELGYADYEKKRAKGSFSVFVSSIVSKYKRKRKSDIKNKGGKDVNADHE